MEMIEKIEIETEQITETLFQLGFEIECIEDSKALDKILEDLKRLECDVGDLFGFAEKQADKEYQEKEKSDVINN